MTDDNLTPDSEQAPPAPDAIVPESAAAPAPEHEPPPEPVAEVHVPADEEAPAAVDEAPESAEEPAAPAPAAPTSKKRWYGVKGQRGREESIKGAMQRKVKMEGLEDFY